MSRAPSPDPSSPSAGAAGAAWAGVFRREVESPQPHLDPSDRFSVPVEPPPRRAEGEESVNGGNAGGGRGKRPAWNVPANGGSDVVALMGAESWPALPGASARSSDSLRAPPDGSSAGVPSGSTIDHSQLKLNAINTNPSFIPNHDALAPQKPSPNPPNSMKRGGGSSSGPSSNHGSRESQQPSRSFEVPPVQEDKDEESSPEDLPNKGNGNLTQHNNDVFSPQLQSGVSPRAAGYNGNRRGNNNGAGGGSSHRGRYSNRRGGYGWNNPRGFNGRDPHIAMALPQHRGQLRPFMQSPPPPPPPPTMAPLFGMPHIRPFVSPISYEFPSIYYFPPPQPLDTLRMPLITHQIPSVVPPAVFISPVDHQRIMLVKQIEYYFSPDNLCKDRFLKENMNDQGWVPISLIAGFNRVKQLTNDISYILDALRGSTVVEIQGEKIRKRGDWRKWILPPSRNQSSQIPQHDSELS